MITSNNIVRICYIAASNGITAVYMNEQMYYLRRDHQGSITGLIDQDGKIVEEYSYDAWGRRRNPTDWTYNNVPTPQYLYRGYTFHEHMDEFGLINMNGRAYDPIIGRFLNPDPMIQNTANTQNYNRYSYCLNNPLKYTDPSGYSYIHNERSAFKFAGHINRNYEKFLYKNGVNSNLWADGTLNAICAALGMSGGNGLSGPMADQRFSESYVKIIGTASHSGKDGNSGGENAPTLSNQGFIQMVAAYAAGMPVVKFSLGNSMSEDGCDPSTDYYPGNFYGVPVYIIPGDGDGGFFDGTNIHVPLSSWNDYVNNGTNSPGGRHLMHEFGHFLQEKLYGMDVYLIDISMPSLCDYWGTWFSVLLGANSKQSWLAYSNNWTEVQANTMSYYYFNFPEGFGNNFFYPMNSSTIPDYYKSTLYYHLFNYSNWP